MSKIVDLTGQRFGRLVVVNSNGKDKYKNILWECLCDCGKTTESVGYSLRSGDKKSCGCLSYERKSELGKKSRKEEIGNTYGMLTVIKDSGERYKGSIYWICECKCGNTAKILGTNLRKGTLSCGCLIGMNTVPIKKDITNQRFGMLTAIKPTGTHINRNCVWECICDCGNIVNYTTGMLNKIKSCGCQSIINSNIPVGVGFMNTSIYQLKNKKLYKNNVSGVKGVSFCKTHEYWISEIVFQGKKYVKTFVCLEKAIKFREEMEKETHGKFINWWEENYGKEV